MSVNVLIMVNMLMGGKMLVMMLFAVISLMMEKLLMAVKVLMRGMMPVVLMAVKILVIVNVLQYVGQCADAFNHLSWRSWRVAYIETTVSLNHSPIGMALAQMSGRTCTADMGDVPMRDCVWKSADYHPVADSPIAHLPDVSRVFAMLCLFYLLDPRTLGPSLSCSFLPCLLPPLLSS